jgi:hypothetical protein
MTTWTNSTGNATNYNRSNSEAGADYLLMETGDSLLLETGDKIYLENFTNYNTNYTSSTSVSTAWT